MLGIEYAIFNPEWIVLDADTWISCCHFAAEFPNAWLLGDHSAAQPRQAEKH
jgi:hypothetical protein